MVRVTAGEHEVGVPHSVPAEVVPGSSCLRPSRKAGFQRKKAFSTYSEGFLQVTMRQTFESIRMSRRVMETRVLTGGREMLSKSQVETDHRSHQPRLCGKETPQAP